MKTNLLIIMTVCFTACVEDRIIYEPMPDQDDTTQIMSNSGGDGVAAQDQPAVEPDVPSEPEVVMEPSSPQTQPPSPQMPDSVTEPEPDPEPEPEPMRPQPSMGASCDLEFEWYVGHNDENEHAFRGTPMPGTTRSLPGSNLIVTSGFDQGYSATAHRISDGVQMFAFEHDTFQGAFDHNWHQRVIISRHRQGADLVLKPVLDAPDIWRIPLPMDSHNHWARFTPDASKVVLVACQEQRGFVRMYSTATGILTDELDLGDRCFEHFFGYDLLSQMTPNGHVMVLTAHSPFGFTDASRVMVRIDFENEEVRDLTVSEETSGALLSMHLNPVTNQLVAVHSEGAIYQWGFPDMTPLGQLGQAGQVRLNSHTYMPSTESPIRFSPDGTLLAHIDLDHTIVVVDAQTQAVRYRLDLSAFEHGERGFNGNTGSEVVDLVFTEDGQSLVARLASGLVAYRCASSVDPQGRDNLSVLLDVPGHVRAGETVELTATHLDASHFHGHAFYVDGELLAEPTTGRHAQWTPIATGMHELTVELIDGINRGQATRFVNVMP